MFPVMFDMPQLACTEFTHCDSVIGDTTYTGDNGWSVTDTYSCSGDCGGYSVGQGAQVDGTTSLSAPTDGNTTQLGTYTDAEGTVYTGDGFTVSDSYTCGSGDCGGFTIVDTYTHAVAGPVAAPSHALAAPVMAAMPEGKSTTVRATPAHFVMTMHALTFGVLSATSKMLAGESDSAWTADFKASASQGAETVTPVGKYVLDKVFA